MKEHITIENTVWGGDEGDDGVRIKRGGIWNEHMPSVLSEHTNSISQTHDIIVSIVASLLMSNCPTGPDPHPQKETYLAGSSGGASGCILVTRLPLASLLL